MSQVLKKQTVWNKNVSMPFLFFSFLLSWIYTDALNWEELSLYANYWTDIYVHERQLLNQIVNIISCSEILVAYS